MIPKNIKNIHIEMAIEEINLQGVPPKRESKSYLVMYKGQAYPPKYLIAIANKYANGELLDAETFSGGQESNQFLINLGYEIQSKP